MWFAGLERSGESGPMSEKLAQHGFLVLSDEGTPVYLRIDSVESVEPVRSVGSQIKTRSGRTHYVDENAEDIMAAVGGVDGR